MVPHQVGLGFNLLQGAPENESLYKQRKKLQAANPDQIVCELDDSLLCFFIFLGLVCGGRQFWARVLIFDKNLRFIPGALLISFGSGGVPSTRTSSFFSDAYFWRAGWLALTGTGTP